MDEQEVDAAFRILRPSQVASLDITTIACADVFYARRGIMAEAQKPEDLDAQTRAHLGERTLVLAEDVFRLNDPHLDAIMRELMLRVGRLIARDLDKPAGCDRVH
jgi:hypothetical protein